jgi:hypothetical protein
MQAVTLTPSEAAAAALAHYRQACRDLLAKRLPARRISDADLDYFEKAIAKIEAT